MKILTTVCAYFMAINCSFAQIPEYYNNIDLTLQGKELKQELSQKITSTHTNPLSYSEVWTVLKQSDLSLENRNKVSLLYGYSDTDNQSDTDLTRSKNSNGGGSQDWNREHSYPKSLGSPNLGTSGPGSDAHHLRASDVRRNGKRGSLKFTSGNGTSKKTNGGWYPGDEWKGDAARMMFYMYLRYNNRCLPKRVAKGNVNSTDPNMIDLLLTWNVEDPVSEFEQQRNSTIASNQGNRNPFIDNPAFATQIWGGIQAENKFGLNALDSLTTIEFSEINHESIALTWKNDFESSVTSYQIYLDNELLEEVTTNKYTITELTDETTYSIKIICLDQDKNQLGKTSFKNITTSLSPNTKLIFSTNFDNCNDQNMTFVSVNSFKDWSCKPSYGVNNSSSIGINGYKEKELSHDIAYITTPIDTDLYRDIQFTFAIASKYGSTPMRVVYKKPKDKNTGWNLFTNGEIDKNETSESFKTFTYSLNELSGEVLIGFEYISNGEPTLYNIDDLEIKGKEKKSVATFEIVTKKVKIYPNPVSQGTSLKIECPNTYS